MLDKIRNTILLSHGGAGKTSLAEAMLFAARAISRLGTVDDGSTTSDYDPAETKRKISIQLSLLPCQWRDTKINLMDAPGYSDFAGEVKAGLRVAESAIINSNYLARALCEDYDLPYADPPLHEFVLSAVPLKKYGVRAGDVAKRLLDFGFHAPTVYFPLIVPEALMVEPTETESRETLDSFIQAMKAIAAEAREDPDKVTSAPHTTPVGRLDEALAARSGRLSYYEGRDDDGSGTGKAGNPAGE